ncbi:MerR family transcriptional regulator [Periweissella cryptocerci]|uniref:MerR family transcriptional regulator n=1 Tax=Periweissella cryptocerci TaxID=2506420 RepID=A0A4P6YUJ4_9LACO|nr:MerR family transcriptional regulator [Periweissella cryptocerci]QBO36412.1 MerR family transcriptional regulator [Periweissella cryptocerci]
MENDMVKNDLMKHVFNSDAMFFRIGELSAMTGVSSRQLRYWEKKNYIQSIQRDDDQTARVFHFQQYARVTGIKYFLDEGYTLATAVAKVNEYIDISKYVHKFVRESIQNVEKHDDAVTIDLGWFNEAKHERLKADLNGDKFEYRIEKS